jgi:prepilin-type N-terminal cleavage/methylation domain-containing protein
MGKRIYSYCLFQENNYAYVILNTLNVPSNKRENMNKNQKGFTIVELLIVIVVIGVLAAITIVAYNGIQQRSRNTQVIAGTQAYYKALRSYEAVNSSYPTQDGCLGANYPGNQCWQGDSGTFSVNATLDASLASFMSTKPTLATSMMSIGITNNIRAGAVYRTAPARIVYYLAGVNQPCVISGSSGVTEGSVVTQCAVTLP